MFESRIVVPKEHLQTDQRGVLGKFLEAATGYIYLKANNIDYRPHHVDLFDLERTEGMRPHRAADFDKRLKAGTFGAVTGAVIVGFYSHSFSAAAAGSIAGACAGFWANAKSIVNRVKAERTLEAKPKQSEHLGWKL